MLNISAQNFVLRNYNIDNGLPHSQVTCVLQDSRGFIWFGLYGVGVCQFDGKNFKLFSMDNGLSSNMVRNIIEDDSGNLLIGSLDSGITLYNGSEFKRLELDSLNNQTIYDLEFNKNRDLWIGTKNGVYTYNETDGLHWLTGKNGWQRAAVVYLYCDSRNRMWFSAWDYGMHCWDGNQLMVFDTTNGLPDVYAMHAIEDKNGDILVGSYSGVCKLPHHDDISKTTVVQLDIPFPTIEQYFMSYIDIYGRYWLGSNKKGIVLYNEEDPKKSRLLNSSNILSGDVTYELYSDREHNIWISSWGGGVSIYTGERFVYYDENQGIKGSVVKTVIADSTGIIVLGSDLLRFDGFGFHPIIINNLKGKIRNTVFSDSKSRLWIGTDQGVVLYDPKAIKTGRMVKEFVGDEYPFLADIRSIKEDSKGNIWLASWGGGLSNYDEKNPKLFSRHEMNAPFLYDLLVDKHDEIWFGTWDQGLGHIDSSGYEFIGKETGIKSLFVNTIVTDNNENIWFGTKGAGVYKLTKTTEGKYETESFSSVDGLTSDVISTIIFSRDFNFLYMFSNKGFDRLNVETYNKTGRKEFRHYGKSEGFTPMEALDHACYFDDSGKLWIGTQKGVWIFDPEKDKIDYPENRTHITDVRLFFEKYDFSPFCDSINLKTGLPVNLVLSYEQNHLSFNFIGINTTAPELVRYKYKLEGLDRDWSPVTDKTEVTYSGLPPGDFDFQVISVNNSGVWNNEPVSFRFEIKPPFWQTTWFYALCIVTTVLGFYMFFKLRTAKLTKDKIVLERKVKERTARIEQQKEEITAQRDAISEQNEEINLQKEEIEAQRDEIEAQRDMAFMQRDQIVQQKREITDSIVYAGLIQSALLATDVLGENVPEYFILFKPRDIVSGDFYWMNTIKGKFIFCAADCTGHGVPGAFMSMMGTAFLNDIILKEGILDPGEILNHLREDVIHALHQKNVPFKNIDLSATQTETRTDPSDLHNLILVNDIQSASPSFTSVKDGMDIALCVYDHSTGELQFAGAYNPLYIIKKAASIENDQRCSLHKKPLKETISGLEEVKSSFSELLEVKANKMPIGIHYSDNQIAFKTHSIQVDCGDMLYVCSDGYADQFGGEKGKKFKSKALKELLLTISTEEVQTQKELLEQHFNKWKGNYEQLDDVCVIGVKI